MNRKNAVRKAEKKDLARIAEIQIFNYRLYFYPVFLNDEFYFSELQVPDLMKTYEDLTDSLYVYDDGTVKGFMQVKDSEICRLFVEPVLHDKGIGSELLRFAVNELNADHLWALEKNEGALRFYKRHGFEVTENRKKEEGTDEYLVLLIRKNGKNERKI